jgi:L-fucose mutarotase
VLKGIDPLLTPDLLKVLAEMGHGDEIVIADANFTATALARGKALVHMPGADVQRTCEAVLSLLPLDAAVARPVAFMQVSDTPEGYRSALQRRVIGRMHRLGHGLALCERFGRLPRAGRRAIVRLVPQPFATSSSEGRGRRADARPNPVPPPPSTPPPPSAPACNHAASAWAACASTTTRGAAGNPPTGAPPGPRLRLTRLTPRRHL